MYSGSTRDWSVSSIRSTNTPPGCLANAQSNSAVRMLPTCRSPLGDGAKRTRTGVPPAAPGDPAGPACSVTVYHPVAQSSDALDRDRHLVTVLERADARRGAGQQHVA